MPLHSLRQLLERYFDLPELMALCHEALGLDPARIGGCEDLGSFSHALLQHCAKHHSLDALCDAALVYKPEALEALTLVRSHDTSALPLASGDELGPFRIEEHLGSGPTGHCYRALRDGRSLRLKVLHRSVLANQKALHRVLAHSRLLNRLTALGLPRNVEAGETDDRIFIAHDWQPGRTLAEHLQNDGPMSTVAARALVMQLLSPVGALHTAGLTAGAIKPSNVLVHSMDNPALTLLDVSANLLLGKVSAPRVDTQAIAALLFEMLSGTKPIAERSPSGPPPSTIVPALGQWLTLVLSDSRPDLDAQQMQHELSDLSLAEVTSTVTDAELTARIEALLNEPSNQAALSQLGDAVAQGADRSVVGKALAQAAKRAAELNEPAQACLLLCRAAELVCATAGANDAEPMLLEALALDARNPQARTLLERLYRALGKSDELIERLLEWSEAAQNPAEKAQFLHKIGSIYEAQGDEEQALLAYTGALCEDPAVPRHATSVDRMAGQNPARWHDVLESAGQAASTLEPVRRRSLLLNMGSWYARLHQIDTAIPCYQAVLDLDAGDERAGTALEKIYREKQQWAPLRALLISQARNARSANRELKLLMDAAEIAELRLQDPALAAQEYEQLLARDPEQERAAEALIRHYQHHRNFASLSQLWKRRAERTQGSQAAQYYCRSAEICLNELKDLDQALVLYRSALQQDPASLDALNGLERILVEKKQDAALLDVLVQQVPLQNTPRQRVEVLLRIASLHEHELLSPQNAARTLEDLLTIDPHHAEAKNGLLRLYQALGRFEDKATLLAGLIGQAPSDQALLPLLLSRAELLSTELKDEARALPAFEAVLEIDPNNAIALGALARLRQSEGDAQAAVNLIERQIEATADKQSKAALLLQMAKLQYERLNAPDRARDTVERALSFNPSLHEAEALAGDLAFEQKRYRDARVHYHGALDHWREFPPGIAARVVLRQVQTLDQLGSPAEALALIPQLLELAPDDSASLICAAQLAFLHGPAEQAHALCEQLLTKQRSALSTEDLATWMFRLGESQRRTGRFDAALATLEEATDLSPGSKAPIEALIALHTSKGDWRSVLQLKQRMLDLSQSSERADLLAEIGELQSEQLGDVTQGMRNLAAALELKPNDRKLLTRLMALYSNSKEWLKLQEVVLRLEKLADNTEQQAKYLLTAAMLSHRELHDPARALELYRQVLALDPTQQKALEESLKLGSELGELETVEQLLVQKLERAQQANSHSELLSVFLDLGSLYKDRLQRPDSAIDAFEAAQTLDPQNAGCIASLTELYCADLERHKVKAIALHVAQLHHDPFRSEPYQQLRRLYTGLRRADPAWCLCRTLNALALSSAEEDQFYERLQSDEAVAIESPLTAQDWQLLFHPDVDPLLTRIFECLEPVVVRVRSESLAQLGYDPDTAIDAALSSEAMPQVVAYVAGALGLPPPYAFDNPAQIEPLALLPTEPACVTFGNPERSADATTQALVFAGARVLSCLQPGLRLRYLLSSGTGFKAWMLAAIRLNSPAFPVPAELVGPVDDALLTLHETLTPGHRDELISLIAKMLQRPTELDLKKWQMGVDFTADRLGFLLSNNLKVAAAAIRQGAQGEVSLAQAARLRELVLFSVDESYFELRKRLHIAIDS